MKTEMIHARVDPTLKHNAELIFNALGINTAEAIRMFLAQVILNQGLPFQLRAPNKETREAIEDSLLNRNLNRVSKEEFDRLFDV
jgi:DNA-damage-inducible protein J